MDAIVARPTGRIVPLPPVASRPLRRAPGAGERRGEILLFMGVRYERVADPQEPEQAPQRFPARFGQRQL